MIMPTHDIIDNRNEKLIDHTAVRVKCKIKNSLGAV